MRNVLNLMTCKKYKTTGEKIMDTESKIAEQATNVANDLELKDIEWDKKYYTAWQCAEDGMDYEESVKYILTPAE